MNILVMGTDRRSGQQTTGEAATAAEWVPGAQRTDTIMVLHINAARDDATLISNGAMRRRPSTRSAAKA